jgi:hypothetical protein
VVNLIEMICLKKLNNINKNLIFEKIKINIGIKIK